MTSQDIVYVRDLQVSTQIGIYAWEQRIKQRISLDLELGTDIRNAAGTDVITNALDYAQVANYVSDFITKNSFVLLESLAEQVAELVLTAFKVNWLRLRVSKPGAVPNAKEVGVVIERTKESQ